MATSNRYRLSVEAKGLSGGNGKPKASPPDPEKANAAATGIANGAQEVVHGRTSGNYRNRPRPARLETLLSRAHRLSIELQISGEAPEELVHLIDVLDAIDAPLAELECDGEGDGNCDDEGDGTVGERDDEDGHCWGAIVLDQRNVCRHIGGRSR